MGGCDFSVTVEGRDAQDAFILAVEEARREYGCDGYTGSIAEKSNYRQITLPKGVSAEDFLTWIEQAGGCPREHLSLVLKARTIYENKWGPALCIELRCPTEGRRRFIFCGVASC